MNTVCVAAFYIDYIKKVLNVHKVPEGFFRVHRREEGPLEGDLHQPALPAD